MGIGMGMGMHVLIDYPQSFKNYAIFKYFYISETYLAVGKCPLIIIYKRLLFSQQAKIFGQEFPILVAGFKQERKTPTGVLSLSEKKKRRKNVGRLWVHTVVV
ncbi:hypothetical protein M0804_009570 [Polistes exclamans]|nr:hypothetical protein M0804_009570 [Polistes exclamans]